MVTRRSNPWALSPAEVRVADALCEGLSMAEVADRLRRSVRTIEIHARRIREKTGARNTTRALILFDRWREQQYAQATSPVDLLRPLLVAFARGGPSSPVPAGSCVCLVGGPAGTEAHLVPASAVDLSRGLLAAELALGARR